MTTSPLMYAVHCDRAPPHFPLLSSSSSSDLFLSQRGRHYFHVLVISWRPKESNSSRSVGEGLIKGPWAPWGGCTTEEKVSPLPATIACVEDLS